MRETITAVVGSWRGILPLSIIAVYGLVALFGPWIVPFDPLSASPIDRLLPPGAETSTGDRAILGTDQVGRDVFAQVISGARISMLVGVATLAIAGIVGSVVGMMSGYFGRPLDGIVMRIADIQLAFPSLLLAIFIASFLGASVMNVIFTLAVTRWVIFARVARGQTLATRTKEFVVGTWALGASHNFILGRCIAPSARGALIVVATMELGLVIIAEASLSFLGLGTPSSSPSWGLTIATGRDYLASGWWVSTMPGIALAVLVVAIGGLGDFLRDVLDPYRQTGVIQKS